jgi:alkyl sulfatase BDS1-like metallo-beta-lactamase superfamily hydrolase
MYRGMTPDELVEHIHLPDNLLDDLAEKVVPVNPETMDPRDYLRKFYGSVPQAVREIYNGYLGWYQADPVALRPTPPVEMARKLVALMGGTDRVLAEARKAEDACTVDDVRSLGQCQWAAELATYLVRIDPDDQPARNVKAAAFETLAQVELDPNWRNWYLSSALELRHVFDGLPATTSGLVSPEIIGHLPPGAWVSSQSLLLKAESTLPTSGGRPKVEMALAFTFTDTAPEPTQRFVLKIDGAVARYIDVDTVAFDPAAGDDAFEQAELRVSLTQATLLDLVTTQSELIAKKEPLNLGTLFAQFVKAGKIELEKGSVEGLQSFFGHFDERPSQLQPLTVR